MSEIVRLPGEDEGWQVGDTQFVQGFAQGSRADLFLIQKDQTMVDLYAELCAAFRGSRIVELGIAAGGSTALVSLLAQPQKLVACDILAEPVAALAEFIERKGLGEVVHPHYGVDQGDREQLTKIIEDEFGDAALDLVIDDASHTWARTVASFEVLFPRLRPGGVFVIEDWPTQYLIAEHITSVRNDPTSARHAELKAQYEETIRQRTPRPPLARLGAELMLATVASPQIIAELRVNQHWLSITRGPAPLEAGAFRVADLYADHFGWFAEEPGDWWMRRLWEPTAPSAS